MGQIPSHWETRRFRFLLAENSLQNTDLKERKQLQFKYGNIVPKANQSEDKDVLDTIKKYTVVAPGDIMINGLNLNYDFISQRVAQVQEPGVITSAYVSLRPLGGANSKYYTYYMKAMDAQKLFHGMGSGVRLTLSYDNLKNLFFPYPSPEEQEAIVSYLDAATAKIDEAIAQQQRMINLLNERQRIIIEKAVTKGINVDVELIDSGVDYIGTIPSHWETRRLGVLGQFTKGGNISRDDLDDDGPEPAILYGDIYTKYFVKVTDIKNHISSKTASASVLVTRGDLLMTGSGETKEDIGKTVVLLAEKAFIGGDVILFKQTKNDSRYLSYVLNSKYSQDYRYRMSKGEIVVHIYPYSLKDLRITLPPVPEQKQIANYLDTRLQAIDNLKQVVLQQIDILQERKQIIVNDVVTGRVKV